MKKLFQTQRGSDRKINYFMQITIRILWLLPGGFVTCRALEYLLFINNLKKILERNEAYSS